MNGYEAGSRKLEIVAAQTSKTGSSGAPLQNCSSSIVSPPYRPKTGGDEGGPPIHNRGDEGGPTLSGAAIAAYRRRTVAMLRRYFRMSLDIGRLPSVLGREFFRARVSSYHVHSFEDVVILVHDVESCLKRLDELARTLVARIALQEYTWEETAAMLGCCRRTVGRRYQQAIDELSETFLRVGLLREMEGPAAEAENFCQEGNEEEESVSCCAAS